MIAVAKYGLPLVAVAARAEHHRPAACQAAWGYAVRSRSAVRTMPTMLARAFADSRGHALTTVAKYTSTAPS